MYIFGIFNNKLKYWIGVEGNKIIVEPEKNNGGAQYNSLSKNIIEEQEN